MNKLKYISLFVDIDELDDLVYTLQNQIEKIIGKEIIGDFEVNFLGEVENLDIKKIENNIILNKEKGSGFSEIILYFIYENCLIGKAEFLYFGAVLDKNQLEQLKFLTNVFTMFLSGFVKKNDYDEISEERTLKASITDLASVVAHEVKTPLQFMLSKIQIMKYKYENDGIKEDVEEIEKEIVRVSEMIHELLDITKFNNDKKNEVIGNLNEMIFSVIHLMNKKLEKENILLNLKLGSEQLEVKISSVIIKQIILNLVNNAIYAVKNCKNKKINVSLYSQNNHAIIEVSDNGMGIKEKDLPLVFKKGFSTKREDGGTGLGLYAVKLFIKSIGASIRIFSEENKGTNFVIKIPLQK